MSIPKKINSKEDVLKNAENNIYFKQSKEMFMQLVEYVFSHKSTFARYMPKVNSALFNWINEVTPKLKDQKYKLNTKVHWIFMGLEDFPECANSECKNKVGIDCNVVWNRGYVKYCCLKCGVQCSRDKSCDTLHKHAAEDPDFINGIVKRRKQTCLKNHGSETWNNRESSAETCLSRYGVKTPMQHEDFCKKSMQTREDKYGKGNMTNYKKTAATCLRRYGHRSVWGNPDIHKKCIDKTIKLYGSPNPGSKYQLDGFKFDSKPEVAFYIWLRDHGIDFTCKPDTSFEYTHEGKTYRYYPDFIVEGCVVEIKGDHFFEDCDPTKKMVNPFLDIQDGQMESKHQCMIENHVKIITSCEYNQYLEYVEATYGKDFIKNLKCS